MYQRVPAAILFAVLSGTLGATRVAFAQATRVAEFSPTTEARVDSIFQVHRRIDAPGYAVGILQKGRLVYAKGFGSANLEHGIPITSRSVFNVASLAKQFTAASIGMLIRQGRLSLDDPVKLRLTEFPAYPGPVRISHLVYMTSGLAEYYTLPRAGGRNWDTDYFTIDDAIAEVLKQPLRFAPGQTWQYSNVNYMLLARIVQRTSGVPFDQFVDRQIFRPLGMVNSRFEVELGTPIPGRVTGYNGSDSTGYRHELRRSPHYGGSGLFSTVEDLARWSRSFETHALGGPELTALLQSTARFQHQKINDAFGLVWGEYRGSRTLWYEGGDAGFSSYMVRLPDEQLTVIVLSNLGTGRAVVYARRVLDVLLPQ
jgi:CubicO group peptidase (beta-lactamase class C family)